VIHFEAVPPDEAPSSLEPRLNVFDNEPPRRTGGEGKDNDEALVDAGSA
jgi:hypothetical protein